MTLVEQTLLEVKRRMDIIDQARAANTAVEQNYIALAQTLVEIEATGAYKEAGYDTFQDFWQQDLGREHSTVSRLMAVGHWLKQNDIRALGTTSYKKLAEAIKAFPDKDPQYVLSAAQTLSRKEIKEANLENKHGVHEHIAGSERWGKCTVCESFIRL
jgi:hypothetical protein